MEKSLGLQGRSESDAIALLRDGICPICLLLVEFVSVGGGMGFDQSDYECESCGHSFTISVDEKFGTETLEFEIIDWDED